MRRKFFYLVTVFDVLVVMCVAYMLWGDWGHVLRMGALNFSFIHVLPLLTFVIGYASYVQSLVEKGEFDLPLEKVKRWRLASYLFWMVLFALLAYLSKASQLYLISLALLIGVLHSAYQLWEEHQHT